MINILNKNYVLNREPACVRALIGSSLGISYFEYQDSRSLSIPRSEHKSIVINETGLVHLIPFYYNEIKFNMITCSKGSVNIKDDEYQMIRERFMLGETEVTQELFEKVMGFNYSSNQDAKCPVENVSWYDCLEFCNRLSDYFNLDRYYELYNKIFNSSDNKGLSGSIHKAELKILQGNGFRLPNESEWQFAAMARTDNEFAGAKDNSSLDRVAWLTSNSGNKTHPVAQKLPNEWGFYDMTGNVYEWCGDILESESNKTLYIRGGSFQAGSRHSKLKLDSVLRGKNIEREAHEKGATVGFRLARTIL
jgi:hypothetical protein